MTHEEAIQVAVDLYERYQVEKTWYANWMVNERTKGMMDFYNEHYAVVEGKYKHTYSMNCRPCIGKVMTFLLNIKSGKTPEQIRRHDEEMVGEYLASLSKVDKNW